MTITVLRCIGCGMIETPQPCLGTCIDRRLDLVDAGSHAEAVAALAALEAELAEQQSLLARLARAADWEPLRPAARAALRARTEPVEGEVITTWACDSCGRIEAPQPCIGVCIRPETPMVEASEHAAVVAAARTVAAELERLAPLLRQLAWSRPRADHREEMQQALRAAAHRALS